MAIEIVIEHKPTQTEQKMKSSLIRMALAVSFLLFFISGCTYIDNTLRFVTLSMNMQEAKLQELYGPGANFDYSWASGEEGSISFDKTGSATIQYGDKQDTGSWNIQGDMLCNKWQKLGTGEEHCYTVYRKFFKKEKFRLFNADGSVYATAFLK